MLCIVVVAAAIAWPRPANARHFLAYSEDSFKTAFASGNLTAAVTHDWPRVVFEHATDPFSSTFQVGLPRLFLFNDSNSDGVFSLSELTYASYLDNNHVTWDVTPVSFGHDATALEYATFQMSASLSLYNGSSNQTLAVSDWATIALRFTISQENVSRSNSLGAYVVAGKTDIAVDLSIGILKPMVASGVVVEQDLVGGGLSDMFDLKQAGANGSVVDEFVSSDVDDTVYGTGFTHRFNATTLPYQEVAFATTDHVVRAYYKWDSEPTVDSGGIAAVLPMASSYIMTSAGMTLHTAYLVGNGTATIHQVSIIGIDEAGFPGPIHNWLRENLVSVIVFTCVMAAVIVVSAVWLVHRRKRGPRSPEKEEPETEKKA